MNKEHAEVIGTLAVTAMALVYMVVLIHQECPSCQSRWMRMRQWFKYYKWRSWFDGQPGWKQEGMIVRGLGPQ